MQEIFAGNPFNRSIWGERIIDNPYCHHEHWDGAGYPRGLKGEEIPFAVRIFSVIDVWDALSSDRCYRLAWDANRVHHYMFEQSGKLLDPTITPSFLCMLDELCDATYP
jgi:HD-GYP domain-containing protein (c-di-GMP phosphodiesterase class II)